MRQISPLQAKEAVEQTMRLKGKPLKMRFDNGYPFANTSDRYLPTALVLWLVSIDIEVIFNAPRSPQQNGSVECTQRISARWANPAKRTDAADLQAALDEVAHDHLHVLRQRNKGDKTRAEQYPSLCSGGKEYDCAGINPQKAKDFLSKFKWVRQVYANGRLCIFSQKIVVGKAYAKQTVAVHYDQYAEQWVVTLTDGKEIIRVPGPELSLEAIKQLTVFSKNLST